MKTPPLCPLAPTEAYRMVVEQIVELDEDLMMRYLEGETVEPDELRAGRPRRDRPGQARAGALRVHSQGPRPSRAARPDLDLRTEPGRHPSLRHPRRPMPTRRKKKSCPPRRARWSPRSSRRSTISSWESSATCVS